MTELIKRYLVFELLINCFSASRVVPNRLRLAILRAWGMEIGSDVAIFPGCVFTSNNIEIGDGCSLNSNCYFDANARITLGKNVAIGIGCVVSTSTHTMSNPEHRAELPVTTAPIVFGNGSGIASHVTVIPGTVLGAGAVVAAGSVAYGNIPPHCFYGGVPAKLIRELDH